MRPMMIAVRLTFFALAMIPAFAGADGHAKIKTCQTIEESGSYSLARNLNAPGDCLVVQADFVTIDLAGFTIKGHGTGRAITDNGAVHTGIEIRNGTITGFAAGIDLSASSGVLVERMRLIGNSGEALRANQMAVVNENILLQNGTGIHVDRLSIVTRNASSQNSGKGIIVGGGSTVIGNTAGENGAHGLEVDNRSTIVNNTARDNVGSGIRVICPGNLIGNTAARNGVNLDLDGAGCQSVDNLVTP